ncbi:hypothetical protein [uncultured Mycobacterium sp.]
MRLLLFAVVLQTWSPRATGNRFAAEAGAWILDRHQDDDQRIHNG